MASPALGCTSEKGRSELSCSSQDPSCTQCSGSKAAAILQFPSSVLRSVAPQALGEHQLGSNCRGINL